MARVPKVARETISRGTPSLRNLPRNIIIIIIIIQTFVLNAPINEEHHIGARSARRESVK